MEVLDRVALRDAAPRQDLLVELGERAGGRVDRQVAAELARGGAELLGAEQERRHDRAARDHDGAGVDGEHPAVVALRDHAARAAALDDDPGDLRTPGNSSAPARKASGM